MIIVFVYDLRWQLVLDRVVLPCAVLFFILNLFLGYNWGQMMLAGIISGGFFALQFFISKGKWIGGGDMRLGLLMGFALGKIDLLILAIILSYFIGSIVGIFLVVSGKKSLSSQVPLGVFLSISTIFSLFWGQNIINWYFGLL
jgi:prepilin signal peptidase PulO-like enzyme (type II secretory pathway)